MSDWTVRHTEAGLWQVQWRGVGFGMPRPTVASAQSYAEHLRRRYPGESAAVLLGTRIPRFRRSGVYVWKCRRGGGTFYARSFKEAKERVRRQLGMSRLPPGIVWVRPMTIRGKDA